jgi:hypothetical protein
LGQARPVLPPSGKAQPKPPPSATVATEASPAGSWSLASVREVTVSVTLENAPDDAELAVEFVAPGNISYERQTARTRGQGKAQHQRFRLPVAGTIIGTGSGLPGTWEARVLLNGEALQKATFALTEATP